MWEVHVGEGAIQDALHILMHQHAAPSGDLAVARLVGHVTAIPRRSALAAPVAMIFKMTLAITHWCCV
jgi:hypothetical protein